ncbi:transcriptional regulator [Nocardiopsis ansamitocini]|uniref:Transcriptional regulator n=2 Tax=Nocardiopsis ansamitocini TaxID=1670832 RepID=A0A9W6UKT9_9ACTN|nr:transcriptional regulator [Nocardiopsis ansamitocini]
MRTFDRMGIHIDQCERCRGIFLDAGELEQIVSAEQRHYTPPPPPPYGGAAQGYRPDSPGPYRGRPDSPGPYKGGGYGYSDSPRPYGHKNRRKGFLENLFD